MPAEPPTLRRSIACSGAIFVLLLAPGCGVDRDTLATPTRYNDPAIVPEEIALFFNQDFEAVEAGRPAEWVARKDREDKVSVVQDGAYSGKSALCIDQGPEWYFVSQAASIDPLLVAGSPHSDRDGQTEGAQLATVNLSLDGHQFSPRGPRATDDEQGRFRAWYRRGGAGPKAVVVEYGKPRRAILFDDARICKMSLKRRFPLYRMPGWYSRTQNCSGTSCTRKASRNAASGIVVLLERIT